MSPRRALIIDDDGLLLSQIKQGLQDAGFLVEAFESPEQALAILERFKPEIVVVDGAMRPYGGPEVLRRVRLVDDRVPVILITAYSARFPEHTSLVKGFDDFVEKPFELPVLLARVEAQLRRVDLGAR